MNISEISKTYSGYIYVVLGAALGFLMKYLYNKLFEKKVDILHEISKPTEFISTPSYIYFQNLKITNKGTITANSLRVNLKNEHIKTYDVSYGVSQDAKYTVEETEGSISLVFYKLLPKEELNISFKSNSLLPKDFIISIKSDENISTDKANPRSTVFGVIGSTVVAVLIFGGFFYGLIKTFNYIDELKNPFIILINTDKSAYKKGDKININCTVQAKKDNSIRDVNIYIEIPGIDLDRIKYHRKINVLNVGKIEIFNAAAEVPKDLPEGKYSVSVTVYGKTLDSIHSRERKVVIDVI